MSIVDYLRGAPRPNPAGTHWVVERAGTGGPISYAVVREARGDVLRVAAEVEAPAPGDFAEGDLVLLSRLAREGKKVPTRSWLARRPDALAPLPPVDGLTGLDVATRRAVRGSDWGSAWSVAPAPALLDLAQAAGVAAGPLAAAAVALVDQFAGARSAAVDYADLQRLMRLVEARPSDAALRDGAAETRDRLREAYRPVGPEPRLPVGAWQGALMAFELARGGGTARLVPGALWESLPNVERHRAGSGQATLVRATLPLRAVLEAAADGAGR